MPITNSTINAYGYEDSRSQCSSSPNEESLTHSKSTNLFLHPVIKVTNPSLTPQEKQKFKMHDCSLLCVISSPLWIRITSFWYWAYTSEGLMMLAMTSSSKDSILGGAISSWPDASRLIDSDTKPWREGGLGRLAMSGWAYHCSWMYGTNNRQITVLD